MTVRTFRPKVQVVLLKNILRQDGESKRYRGTRTTVDLSEHLGEQGSVVIRKSLYAPMGQWEVTLTDQRQADTQDTLYAFVEPMDGVEIRLAREPHAADYRGNLPVIMRGFVTGVRRVEAMGDNGRPQRSVVIQGADYGLALSRIRISWLQHTGAALLANYGRIEAVGLPFKPWLASDFVRDVVKFTIMPWLNEFYGLSEGNPDKGKSSYAPVARSLAVDATVMEGTVNPFGINPFDRPVWEWLCEHCDLTWNEIFIEDRQDAPTLVYRPVPFKDIDGKWIPQGSSAVYAETVDVQDDAVMSMDVSRTDANVANVFWANPTATSLIPASTLKAVAFYAGQVIVDLPNSKLELYGTRLMMPNMAQGPTGIGRLSGLPTAEQAQVDVDYVSWCAQRRATLIALNKDNVAFEDVSMSLRGNERVRPGKYLRLDRGGFKSECYVHAVTHEFQPFQSFTTHVSAIRGTGLLVRSRMLDSPYGAEGRAGAYG